MIDHVKDFIKIATMILGFYLVIDRIPTKQEVNEIVESKIAPITARQDMILTRLDMLEGKMSFK